MAASAARCLTTALRRNAGVRQLGVLRTRGGDRKWGLPLPMKEVDAPVPEEFELWWAGEHVYEDFDNPISKWEALGMLCCGLSFFAVLGWLASIRVKYLKRPFPPKEFPWLEEWDRLIPAENREIEYNSPLVNSSFIYRKPPSDVV